MKKLFLVLFALCALSLIGCGEDDAPTGSGGDAKGTVYDFDSYRQWVDMVAPAVYVAPVAAPSGQFDSMWTEGSNPLLGKVFGENEPMSLYANVEYLDEVVAELNSILSQGDSSSFVVDTPWVSLIDINGAQALPGSVVSIMGFSSVTLDRALLIDNPDGDTTHVGFILTDSTQTVLAYRRSPYQGSWESFLFYGHVNTNDSTVDIKGVFYKVESDQSAHSWVYDIQTVNEVDFAYRMSWYAPDMGDTTGLGCIIGGGDADDQFAMRYRQYIPADAPTVDSIAILDQMFDAQYNYLGAIAAGYETFVDVNDLFLYGDMPQALVESPWDGQ